MGEEDEPKIILMARFITTLSFGARSIHLGLTGGHVFGSPRCTIGCSTVGHILPWLVESKAAETCDERQFNLGNLALSRTAGTAGAGGSILKWDKKLPLPER